MRGNKVFVIPAKAGMTNQVVFVLKKIKSIGKRYELWNRRFEPPCRLRRHPLDFRRWRHYLEQSLAQNGVNSQAGKCGGDLTGKAATGFLLFGGEGGIRTHGSLRINGFQDRRNRPLCHLSKQELATDRLCRHTTARTVLRSWLKCSMYTHSLQAFRIIRTCLTVSRFCLAAMNFRLRNMSRC